MSVHGCWLVSDAYHRSQDPEQHVDKTLLCKVGAALAGALDADTMMQMAKACGFCQRMRSVAPRELVVAVFAAMATRHTETIVDVQRTFNALKGRDLADKPFHKRLAKPSFSEPVRRSVAHLMNELVVEALRPLHHSALNLFDAILLHDGSSFAVHDALAHVFPPSDVYQSYRLNWQVELLFKEGEVVLQSARVRHHHGAHCGRSTVGGARRMHP
jgi:hypothetical protein